MPGCPSVLVKSQLYLYVNAAHSGLSDVHELTKKLKKISMFGTSSLMP